MQTKESIEIDRAARRVAQRLRNRDRRSHRVVRFFPMRDDDVEPVCRSALEQADENLSLRRVEQVHAERRPPQETGTESHRHQRQRSRFYECSAFHRSLLVPLEFRRAERESHYRWNAAELRNVAEPASLKRGSLSAPVLLTWRPHVLSVP